MINTKKDKFKLSSNHDIRSLLNKNIPDAEYIDYCTFVEKCIEFQLKYDRQLTRIFLSFLIPFAIFITSMLLYNSAILNNLSDEVLICFIGFTFVIIILPIIFVWDAFATNKRILNKSKTLFEVQKETMSHNKNKVKLDAIPTITYKIGLPDENYNDVPVIVESVRNKAIEDTKLNKFIKENGGF